MRSDRLSCCKMKDLPGGKILTVNFFLEGLFYLLTSVRLSFNMRCRFSPGAAAANRPKSAAGAKPV
jgi:hypothetical protein